MKIKFYSLYGYLYDIIHLTMKKEILETLINEGKSLNQVSKDTGKSLTTIRYWVKKYDLKSTHKPFKLIEKKVFGDFRYCSGCKKDCPIDQFYQRRGIKNASTYCKSCTTKQTLKRMQKLKKTMVDYKGGECSICGYKKYLGALEFHHLDPNKKDFNLAHMKKYSFDERVKNELDKCILVCSNCHRELHGKIVVPPGFEPGIED